MRVLFVCSRNRLRSPTAEQVFADHPGVEVASAGTEKDAEEPVTGERLAWADLIVCMERAHLSKLQARFRPFLKDQRVVVLGVRDAYDFMDPELVELLERKVGPYLP